MRSISNFQYTKTGTCETSFVNCIGGTQTPDQFRTCMDSLSTLSGCVDGCAPTKEMLVQSEAAVVSLSQGNFGTQAGLTVASNPPPEPDCDFGSFSLGSGNFAGCTLGTPDSSSPGPDSSSSSSSDDGSTVFIVIGVVVAAVLIVLVMYMLIRCKSKKVGMPSK